MNLYDHGSSSSLEEVPWNSSQHCLVFTVGSFTREHICLSHLFTPIKRVWANFASPMDFHSITGLKTQS